MRRRHRRARSENALEEVHRDECADAWIEHRCGLGQCKHRNDRNVCFRALVVLLYDITTMYVENMYV